jgi:hypothetical protein
MNRTIKKEVMCREKNRKKMEQQRKKEENYMPIKQINRSVKLDNNEINNMRTKIKKINEQMKNNEFVDRELELKKQAEEKKEKNKNKEILKLDDKRNISKNIKDDYIKRENYKNLCSNKFNLIEKSQKTQNDIKQLKNNNEVNEEKEITKIANDLNQDLKGFNNDEKEIILNSLSQYYDNNNDEKIISENSNLKNMNVNQLMKIKDFTENLKHNTRNNNMKVIGVIKVLTDENKNNRCPNKSRMNLETGKCKKVYKKRTKKKCGRWNEYNTKSKRCVKKNNKSMNKSIKKQKKCKKNQTFKKGKCVKKK